ncbi:hypothetical protein E8P82_09420 [Arthrobacter echini]|uniref:DUF8094 domain-containing protein n=1 Tax=Arthrobacter echini TaxID=1529066 RepID=A0A4S5E493_9MICC|nr:hypothetical protein [Arthrobacter echini]THJ66212.1 hypothetical protein E8P82_09420 [Arthrobacter echini]
MRVKAAVPIIVAGLVLMLVGIGLQTLWKPAETLTSSTTRQTTSAPVTVILPEARGRQSADVEVTVDGEGPFTLAVGRASDVEAWVGEAAHLSVTGIDEDVLSTEYTEGEASVPDPRGSDLWISEEAVQGSTSYRWSEPVEGEWSILLATGGRTTAPTQISITRPNDQSASLALPLIIGGALVVVLGIALLFIAPRDRSGQGRPDAPGRRRPPGRARAADGGRGGAPSTAAPSIAAPRVILVLVGLLGAGSLLAPLPALAAVPVDVERIPDTATPTATATAIASATGDPEPPLATGAPSPGSVASGPPVVLEEQLERILRAVAGTVAAADAASDPDLLEPRVDGAALETRAAAYALAAADAGLPAPAPVAAAPVLLDMIPTDDQWPRTLVALTQGTDDPVPQALLLVQESPRENYRLVSAVQMLPGSTFPTPPVPGATGPIPLDEDGALKLAPQEAVRAIADVLTEPDGDNERIFEENSFAEAITRFQAEVRADPGNSAATISFTHRAQEESTQALSTGDGGAMVFGYLRHAYSSVPASGDDAIDLGGTVYETLTGEAASATGIDISYGEAVMMYVPPAGSSDQVRVVGAVQQLLSAQLR